MHRKIEKKKTSPRWANDQPKQALATLTQDKRTILFLAEANGILTETGEFDGRQFAIGFNRRLMRYQTYLTNDKSRFKICLSKMQRIVMYPWYSNRSATIEREPFLYVNTKAYIYVFIYVHDENEKINTRMPFTDKECPLAIRTQ